MRLCVRRERPHCGIHRGCDAGTAGSVVAYDRFLATGLHYATTEMGAGQPAARTHLTGSACTVPLMGERRRHWLLDRVFAIGLILKGLDGVLELIGGVLLLLVTPEQIGDLVQVLTQHELREDPHDLIANALVHFAGTLDVSATLFGAIYLLVHGAVKVALVAAVLRGHLWAYPWLIGFLVLFIGYQVFDMMVHFTWGMLVLTLFDAFIVVLTVREYRIHRARQREKAQAPPVA